MAKENAKAVKHFQELLKLRKKLVKKDDLVNLGVDISISPQEFRNIVLKKDFFGDWGISVKNETHDLDGLPIAENKKLLQIIKAHYGNGKKELSNEELLNLNIIMSGSEFKIGNFRLGLPFLSSKYYIELIDKNKNTDGLWIDSVIDKDKVLGIIHKFSLTKIALSKMKEMDLNKKLEEHFKNYFAVVKRGGSSNKGLVDLILGDNKFGIELKLARELKKPDQSDRARGQLERYKEEFKSNFMMVIAGTDEEKKEKSVQDLLKKIKETSTLHYYIVAQ
ncbi:MAG: hypothetical protein ACOZCO_10505 [Bacteroidota bacterium]